MAYDEKLVEAVAREIRREHCANEPPDDGLWWAYAPLALAALAAIDASDTHLVAPRTPTARMESVCAMGIPGEGQIADAWSEMCDACLAERRGDDT